MNSGAVLLEKHWECPNCDSAAVTRDAKVPMHLCPKLGGLMVALVPAGQKCKVEAVERGDYVGQELVQTDGHGRPVMAVLTTRDDGQDCTVFAPTAQGTKE